VIQRLGAGGPGLDRTSASFFRVVVSWPRQRCPPPCKPNASCCSTESLIRIFRRASKREEAAERHERETWRLFHQHREQHGCWFLEWEGSPTPREWRGRRLRPCDFCHPEHACLRQACRATCFSNDARKTPACLKRGEAGQPEPGLRKQGSVTGLRLAQAV